MLLDANQEVDDTVVCTAQNIQPQVIAGRDFDVRRHAVNKWIIRECIRVKWLQLLAAKLPVQALLNELEDNQHGLEYWEDGLDQLEDKIPDNGSLDLSTQMD